jgi:uncharacterized protein (TIGR02594 family)
MKTKIIDIALQEFGHREIAGKEDNPEILKYFNDIGFDGQEFKDETAWCAAFANWVLLKANLKGTGKLNARSFLNVGTQTDTPVKGDLVVLWRNSPEDWRGHVGFFIRKTKDEIYILGGNQGNRVSINAYPTKRLLNFRTFENEF